MKSQTKLFVKAVPNANVHEMGPDGNFITGHGQPRRNVGKTFNPTTREWDIIPEGVFVFYHPEYIRHLKEQSLLPANIETAVAAGITWSEIKKVSK